MLKARVKRSRLHILYALLTAMTLLGLFAAFAFSWFWNMQRIQTQFAAETHMVSQYVREKMAQNETLLVGLSTYFKGQTIDPQAVRNYASIMTRRFPHIYMFQAAQFLKSANWKHYVEYMERQNSKAELLRFINGEGVIQEVMTEGEVALPVIMIEPSVETSRLGLDLSTIDFINDHIPQDTSERIVLIEPFLMLDDDKVMVMMQSVVRNGSPHFLSLLVVKVTDLLPSILAEFQSVSVDLGVLIGGERFQLASSDTPENTSLSSWFPAFEIKKTVDFTDYRLELNFNRQFDWQDIQWGWLTLLIVAIVLLPALYRFMFTIHSRAEADEEIRRQQLYRQANYDALSGLPNRYYFEDYASRLLSTAQRSNTDLALFFIDLNGFKAINDNLGHDIGDQVLERVGSALASALRRGDMAARVGGDEFTVLVDPVLDMERLLLLMEKIRGIILSVNSPDFAPYHVSASLGFAYTRVHGFDLTNLTRIADGAMYEEKRNHHSQKFVS